jgi:hypothetical protein
VAGRDINKETVKDLEVEVVVTQGHDLLIQAVGLLQEIEEDTRRAVEETKNTKLQGVQAADLVDQGVQGVKVLNTGKRADQGQPHCIRSMNQNLIQNHPQNLTLDLHPKIKACPLRSTLNQRVPLKLIIGIV